LPNPNPYPNISTKPESTPIGSIKVLAPLKAPLNTSVSTEIFGNGVRVFLALRNLNHHKPDDVLYKMVIKSIVRRRKKIQIKSKELVKTHVQTYVQGGENREGVENQRVENREGGREEGDIDSDFECLTMLLKTMREDGIKPSTLTYREVLFFFFSRSVHSIQ
jgi:hypothetical protein